MTKKIAVVGSIGQIAAAAAHALMSAPGSIVNVDMTGVNGAILTVDELGQNIGYDPKMIEKLTGSLSERELYGITMPDALALINDRKLGEYRQDRDPAELMKDVRVDHYDDLPENTTKPKFLMARDHHIRSPRGRR